MKKEVERTTNTTGTAENARLICQKAIVYVGMGGCILLSMALMIFFVVSYMR